MWLSRLSVRSEVSRIQVWPCVLDTTSLVIGLDRIRGVSQILRRHRRLCRIPFAQRDERSGPARSLKVAGSALFSPMAGWPPLAVMWPVIWLKLRVQASSAAGVRSRCWRVTVCRPGRRWLGSVVWWTRPENRQRPAAAAACIGRMKTARRLVVWSETGCASVLCRVIA